jgi:hypothetical protein
MKAENLLHLERAERMMWRWMCGVKLADRRPSTELSKCLDVEPVADVVRRGRLRWFGHVERKSGKDWVSRPVKVLWLVQHKGGGRGRSKKTRDECVCQDLRRLGLRTEPSQDRMEWRRLIVGNRLTRAEHGKMDVKR